MTLICGDLDNKGILTVATWKNCSKCGYAGPPPRQCEEHNGGPDKPLKFRLIKENKPSKEIKKE